MAKQTIVRLIDDLDRTEATRTIGFSWNGVAYEIDLNAKNAKAFEQAIDPYVNAARRARAQGRGSAGRRAATAATGKLDLAAVRAWAVANGHKVADRGRIPRPVLEAFHAAQHAVSDLGGKPARPAAAKRSAPAKRPAARRAAAAAKRPAAKTTATKRGGASRAAR